MESDAKPVGPQHPPHPLLHDYYADESGRRTYLDQAFDVSARYYDKVNWFIGFGTDRWYRREALLRSGLAAGMSMLDVGCGTGLSAAMAVDIVGPQGHVVGVEPSRGMLWEAFRQRRVHTGVRGMAERLPLVDNSFDFLCMSFALRHVADLQIAFREFNRVLKPSGILLIVEMTIPQAGTLYRLLRFYMKSVVPLITRLCSGSRVAQELYTYCWETHDQCVPSDTIVEAMGRVGFQDVKRWVDIGIFSQYTGKKAGQ